MRRSLRRATKAASAVLIELPLVVLSYFVGKRRGLWVFLPVFYEAEPFNGNIKYLFRHVVRFHPEIDSWCLGVRERDRRRNPECGEHMRSRRYSPANIVRILRAEYVFVDGLTRLSLGTFRVVQLWHGTGFKNIAGRTPGAGSLAERFRRGDALADTVIAGSDADRERKQACFRARRVVVTGNPRTDVLFERDSARSRRIRKELCLPLDRRIVGYAPTYRDTGASKPFSEAEWLELDELARQHGFAFAIKKHPADARLKVPAGLQHVHDVSERAREVQEYLSIVDLLVSDYSSIVTDFVAVGRPIVFFVYDFESYVATCRDFYYDLASVLPGPFARNAGELFALLRDDRWREERAYRERFERFASTFDRFRDGRSCERVVAAV